MREATAKPIVGVGRLTNPDRMAEIVRSGAWDLIGAARPSIADPFLPKKVEEGRYGEVRECIGCNICVMKAEEGNHIGCTQNATAGEEYRRGWHPERFEPAENRDRDVLVVGAGPAGMECAIVLGKRGFRRVHLVEAEPRSAASPAGSRAARARRVGPDELAHRPAREASERRGAHRPAPRRRGVREYGAEIVVVATGRAGRPTGSTSSPTSRSRRRRVAPARPHAGAGHARRQAPPGGRVLVFDAEGYFMAAGLAEKLAADGFSVELVTPHERVAPSATRPSRADAPPHLHDLGTPCGRGRCSPGSSRGA